MNNNLTTSFFIAYKSIIRGHKSTLVLMMIILSLSFFNMMFVPGIFSGLFNAILAVEINTSTSDIAISAQQSPVPEEFISDQSQLRGQIQTIPGVVATTRTYLTAGSISFDKDKNGVYRTVSASITGIDPTESQKVLSLKKYLIAGQFLSDTDTDQIIISAGIAGGYGLPEPNDLGGARVGDKVNVVYGNGVMRTYTVKGITNITFGSALSNTYITTKEAESVLSVSDEASQILVKVNNLNNLAYYKSRIEAMAPNLKVQTYADLLSAIQPILSAFTLIALIVSAISILVAAVTIFVMIYVNAVNKRRQIGILKAIGIKERIIVYSYIFQSLFYVLCGLAIGLILVFFILTPLIAAYPIHLPFGALTLSFSFTEIMEAVLAFLLAGFFAGLIPSRIVAREDILTAIWG